MSDTLFPIPESESKIAVSPVKGKPRLIVPNRAQIELRPVDLESLLATDHPARGVWDFVESLDLSPLYAKVEAVEGVAGRPAIDPRIYLALIATAVADLHTHHDLRLGVDGKLGVIGRPKSSIAHLHHPRLSIRRGYAGLVLRGRRLLRFGLRHLRQRRLDSTTPILSRTLTGCRLATTRRLRIFL